MAVDADFGALVLVLAATGCRFSQAATLTVRDLQIDARRILVPSSRKGRSAKARPQIAVPLVFGGFGAALGAVPVFVATGVFLLGAGALSLKSAGSKLPGIQETRS